MRLRVVPVRSADAFAFVEEHHRHHAAQAGGLWCIGARDEGGQLRGVAIVGRPVSRVLDDGLTCEVTRLVTDGTPHVCSKLYGAARRVAQAMGYLRILTYTMASEPGTSLRAAGWSHTATVHGRSWSCESRPREDRGTTQDKLRWEAN